MTRRELNNAYFNWMYRLVCDDRYPKKLSYRKLMKHLHSIDFYYILAMDGNRAEDGTDLRYRFGYEHKYEGPMIASYLDDRPCSVLEMLIALAIRCEDQIMCNTDIGDRTGQWFWTMITNLNLASMNDDNFDPERVDIIIERFMSRKYGRNGEGGLFTVKHSRRDMRSTEIWYQMCEYIGEFV